MLISKALDLFIIEKQIAGCEVRTLDNYRRIVGYFIDFSGDLDISEVTKEHIKAYQLFLATKPGEKYFAKGPMQPISRTTTRTYMTHIRAFFNYLFIEEYMSVKVFERVKLPKQKRKEIEILTPEEIQKLWTYFKKTEPGIRYKCFICLLLDTGIRLSEALNLKLTDVSLEKAEIILRDTKSGHERIVPMGHLTRKELFKYINKYRYISLDGKETLFTMHDGRSMSSDAIKSLFMRLKKHLNRRIYPHLLRHTFATLYLAEYRDIYALKQILGHHDIAMTNLYLQMANRLAVKHRSLMDDISKTRKLNGLENASFFTR